MNNKVKNIFKSFGLIFLVLFFSSIFFAVFNIDLNNISDTNYVIYLTISNLILSIIFLYIYRNTLINDAKSFFKNFGKNIEISFKYWIAGFTLMIVSNLVITFILNKELAGNEMAVRSYISALPVLMVIDVSIFAPLTEEIAFRKSIRDVISNKWLYVAISGLVFGFLHILGYITNISDLVYLIPYGALGITFALLYYKTNNIFSTITMHGLHNFIAVILYLIGELL